MARQVEAVKRLQRIEGHVYSLRKMLEEGRTYPEVVQQILAVRSSLDGVVNVLVEDLAESCVNGAGGNEELKKNATQLKEVVSMIK